MAHIPFWLTINFECLSWNLATMIGVWLWFPPFERNHGESETVIDEKKMSTSFENISNKETKVIVIWRFCDTKKKYSHALTVHNSQFVNHHVMIRFALWIQKMIQILKILLSYDWMILIMILWKKFGCANGVQSLLLWK